MTDSDLLVTIDADGPLPGRYGIYGRPAAVALDRFVAFADKHAALPEAERSYARAILVGDGERLEAEGFEFASTARKGGFRHVRLDTSPRRLVEGPQVRAVVLAGVDEFSLGLHGHEPGLHDKLTGRAGEFDAVTQALTRLSRHEVRVMVDTVVSAANLEALPKILARVLEAKVARVTLWSHCPPGDSSGPGIVPFSTLVPALSAAVEPCREAGVDLRIRRVPACLLGVHADILDNQVPDALDGIRPGRPLAQFNCLLEAQCELAESCGGLDHSYVNAHGWELERLRPVARTRPWVPRDRSVEHQTGGVNGPRGHAPWLALLGEHADLVESVGLTRGEARYPMQMADGTRFILVLTRRDSTVRYFRQSRSFNLAYTDVEGSAAERAIANHVEPVLATIIANDDASLTLS